LWGKIKSGVSKLIPIVKEKALSYARDNKILSQGAKELGAGQGLVGAINSLTGMGRRTRSSIPRATLGGRRRRTTRRTTRRRRTLRGGAMGMYNVTPRISLFGGRRRRVGRPRVRRTLRGRGFFGKMAGGLLGGLLPF